MMKNIFKKVFGVAIVAILLVLSATTVLAQSTYNGYNYGSGTSGLSPYGSGTSGLNPYGSGTSGLNPYGSGTSGLNPYGTGSTGLNPYGTGSTGLNPYASPDNPIGTSDSGPTTGNTPNDPNSPNGPTTGPIDDGPTWATLSNQVIPEDSPVGTNVYPGLANLCFDDVATAVSVITNSPNFDVSFSGDDLVLDSLTANWNGQELIGLDCNGEQASFVLTVSPVNDAPTFTTSPVTTVSRNSVYNYDANAVDVENDPFTFALITGPNGMTVNSATGLVTWGGASSGSYPVTIRVTDNQGAFTDQVYTISVSTGGGGGSGGSGGGSSGSGHSVRIGRFSPDKNTYVCGDTLDFTVDVDNFGRFTESVIINLENDDLGIFQTLNRDIKRSISDEFGFSLDIPEGIESGLYTFVTKMTYGNGEDYDYKTVSIVCEEEKIPEVITITEDEPEEEERSIWVLVTLILAVLAGVALLVWFVLLLRDEFATTERFI